MVTIVNPYKPDNTLGESLSGLGEAFFGPKASAAALYREKFREVERQNLGVNDLARLVETGVLDPKQLSGASIRAGLDPKVPAGYGHYVGTTGMDLRDPAQASRASTSAFAIPGTDYRSTPNYAIDQLANEKAKQQIASNRAFDTAIATANNTPISVRAPTPEDPNRTIITSRAEAIKNNLTPILSTTEAEGTIRLGGFGSGYTGFNPSQLEAAGVAPKTTGQGQVKTVVITNDATGEITQQVLSRDGVSSVDGKPIVIPPGHSPRIIGSENPTAISGLTASPEKNELRTSRIATATANDVIDRLTTNLNKPGADAALGLVGWGAAGFNQLRAQVDAVAGVSRELGFDRVANLFDAGAKDLVSSNPGLQGTMQRLNIQRGVLESQISSLAYAIAKSNNPSGQIHVRDVSDAMATIGATINDPVAFSAVLNDVKTRINAHQAIREKVIGQGSSQQTRRVLDIGNPAQSGGGVVSPGIAPPPGFVLD